MEVVTSREVTVCAKPLEIKKKKNLAYLWVSQDNFNIFLREDTLLKKE